MPDINAWLNDTSTLGVTAADRAVDAWQRIQDDPVTVAVHRAGAFDHNEIVRLEWDNSTNALPQQENTVAVLTRVTAFGVVGHPAVAVTDTDIEEGDEIALSGEVYQVKDVLQPPGEAQARCVRIT